MEPLSAGLTLVLTADPNHKLISATIRPGLAAPEDRRIVSFKSTANFD